MVEVTQADRAAAASLEPDGRERDQILRGKRDKTKRVQAFALHRIATEQDCARQRDFWTATAYSCGYDAAGAEIEALRTALHDAIRRPMGVVPESAEPFYSPAEADRAEARRAD